MDKTKRGLYNSSITRVRPFFRLLFSKDRTGTTWLPKLLLSMTLNKQYSKMLAEKDCQIMPYLLDYRAFHDKILGKILLENCFEYPLPPTKDFLKWMIENPYELTWPKNGKMKYGEETQISREQLMDLHGKELQDHSMQDALHELSQYGAEGSKKKWWAFEGFTEMDCLLETDDFLIGIEGKRNEPVSPSTHWFPQRNQIIRNLEVLKQKAGNKEYALLLMSEDGIDQITDKTYYESLPHYLPEQIEDIKKHYLGCISWSDACVSTGTSLDKLPENALEVHR